MSETRISRRSRHERRTGETDWARLERTSDEDIERQVASDPDAAPLLDDEWFKEAELVSPNKQLISIRVDKDVLDFFRSTGKQYQTRMNSVLRAYMEAIKRRAG